MPLFLIAANPFRFSSLFLMGTSLFLLAMFVRSLAVSSRHSIALNHLVYGSLLLGTRHFLEVFVSFPALREIRHVSTVILLLGLAFLLEACRLRNQPPEGGSGFPGSLVHLLGWIVLFMIPGFVSEALPECSEFSPAISWPILGVTLGLGILPLWLASREEALPGKALRNISILWWVQAGFLIPLFHFSPPCPSVFFNGICGEYSLFVRGLILLAALLPIWTEAPLSPNLRGNHRPQLHQARRRFSLLLFFILSCTYLGAFFVCQNEMKEIFTEGTRDTLLITSFTQQLIERTQAGSILLTTSPSILNLVSSVSPNLLERANLTVDRYCRTFPNSLVYVMDATGTVLVSSNRQEPANLVGKSFRFRPYFSEAIKGAPALYFALGKVTGERGLYCSAPIHNPSGTIHLGVAAIKISLNHLDERFSMVPPTFLVDEKGIILSGNQPQQLLRPLWPIPEAQLKECLASNQYGSQIASPVFSFKPQPGQEIRFGSENALFTHTFLPESRWSLVQFSPTTRADLYPRWLFGLALLLMALSWASLHNSEQQMFAEAGLQQSEERFRGIFEYSPMGIVLTEAISGRIRDINPAGSQLIGLDRHSITGKPREAFFPEQCLIPGSDTIPPATDDEPLLRNHQGHLIPLLKKTVRLNFWGRDFFLESFFDISQRKHMEHELQTAKERAEAANLAKSRFLATMSHELKTPLNAILGFAEILLMETRDENQKNDLRLLRNAGKDLLSMINNILEFSQEGDLSTRVVDTSFEPALLMNQVIEKHLEVLSRKSLRLKKEIAPHMPERVVGVPQLIGQILDQLLANAVKFTTAGEIGVSVTFSHGQGLQNRLEFTVSDTGTGIPPEKLSLLFHPFTQIDGSHSRKFGGVGLGLAFCKQLAEAISGTIQVVSQPGKGSRFTLSVPVKSVTVPKAEPPTTRGAEAKAPSSAQGSPDGGAGPELLLVEDNEVNQLMALSLLQRAGYRVTLARNGHEALDWVRKKYFHAILMDLQMPEMDGASTTRAIREEEKLGGRRTLIIALSANSSREDQRVCVEAGMDGFLSKPLDLLTLRKLLEPVQRDRAPSLSQPGASGKSEKLVPSAIPTLSENIPVDPRPSFDPEKLLERVCQDRSVLAQLCQMFFERIPHQIQELEDALDSQNASQAAQIAHKIKGAVGNFSAGEAFDIAAAMEAGLRQGNICTSSQRDGLKQAMVRLQKDLKAFLARAA